MGIRRLRPLFAVPATLALVAAGGVTATTAIAGPASCDTRVNNTIKKLLDCVDLAGVREHQAAFQAIADANGGTRVSGTPGYDASVDYVVERLEAAGWETTVQEFEFQTFITLGPTVLERISPPPAGPVPTTIFSYSGSGDVTATVSRSADAGSGNEGCEAADFAGFPAGDIALVQRGACSFAIKATNAYNAGASAVIIWNNQPGVINGTLGNGFTLDIPVVSATQADGAELAATPGLVMRVKTETFRGIATTYNVLAELAGKNADNVVMAGAHLDSVNEGPGINDNGSGSAALIEVAENLSKVKPQNTLRFAWWGAEESGLVGSSYYVDNLSQSELDTIALYLNYDMIGSPNHVFFIYDGDDSDGVGAGPGPAGSAQIEETFEAFFEMRGEPYKGTDFSGRSDYGPFIAVGIPSGGLFTGAEGIKTPEEAAIWGGTAGQQYDPCYHLACDTYDNNNNHALAVNSDAVAYAALQYAMSTELINGTKSKGNFRPGAHDEHDHVMAS
jgi:Zn-dependent M28 family amino/carboxypeptidase